MRTLFVVVLTCAPLTAVADGGGHFHPHAIEYGWVIWAALGVGAGFALARWRT